MRKIFIFSLFILGIPLFLHASRADDLRSDIKNKESEIKALEAEIKAYQERIDSKESEAKTLKNEISKLESVIQKLNLDIKLTEQKIEASELNLEELDIEIKDKNNSIEERKESLAEIMRAINQTDSTSLLEMVLRSDKFSNFFEDVRTKEELGKSINENLFKLRDLKAELEEKKTDELKIKNDLSDLKGELGDKKSIQVSSKNSKNDLLKETKNQEASFQKLLSEREKKRAEIQDDIDKIELELKKLIDESSLPQSSSGVLAWPVANVKITQGYGKTDFALATDVYRQKSHNGIDFRASVGTPIMAAEEGVIKGVGNADLYCPGGSYGKWILIEHPNKLSSLYAHLSFIKVLIGQNIKRGEIIGYSGNTGYTTGPHLHFTVYDARTVYIKTSKVCGPLPYGGYLNPLLYL